MISKLNIDGGPYWEAAPKDEIIELKKDEDIVHELERMQHR
jgi:hypothetical protein